MKLNTKVFIISGMLWIVFLLLAYFLAEKSLLISFAMLAVGFSFLVIGFIQYEISNQAKKNPPDRKKVLQESIKDESAVARQIVQNESTPDYRTLVKEFNNDPLSRFDHDEHKLVDFPNIILFNQLLNKAISHARRHNKILAILIVDFTPQNADKDNMEVLNDDSLLEFGNRLVETIRNEDIIAKLEGNQFIILLSDIEKPKFAGTVAKKLLTACAPTLLVNFKELIIKTSIGICIFPNDGVSLAEIIKKGYQALIKAKETEGNSFLFYTEKLDREAREYNRLDADLRMALRNRELVLYYQPKLRIKDGSVAGVEALIRWMHPELGLLTPSKFMTVAEESGLIMQLGEWAIFEACKTNKYWQKEGYEHLTVAINISPKQFYHPNTCKMIEDILEKTQLEPHYLELEISEITVMDNPDKSKEIINALQEIGVRISIDHFGTGYTSINQLKQFPVTSLKIDRSFIKDIPNKPDDAAITSAIITLGHHLGMEVIAEGVETPEQMQYLTMQNCDVVQGYFLSYPVPAPTIVLQFKKLSEKSLI